MYVGLKSSFDKIIRNYLIYNLSDFYFILLLLNLIDYEISSGSIKSYKI